jgi:hypothetical protein
VLAVSLAAVTIAVVAVPLLLRLDVPGRPWSETVDSRES